MTRELSLSHRVIPDWTRHLIWLPLSAAVTYLVFVLAKFDDILRLVYANSDASFARVLVGDLQADQRRGLIKVGEAAHYSTLWFLTMTRSAPFRELLWDASPFFLSLATSGLVAWACWKSAGKFPALLTICCMVTLTPPVLATTLPQGMRNHTWFSMSFLVALLVFLASRGERLGARTKVAAGVVASIISGVTLASDPLFLGSGLLPFWGAGLLAWLRFRTPAHRSIAVFASAVSVPAVFLSGTIARFMHSRGYRKTYLSQGYSFATPKQIQANLGSLLNNLLDMTNADQFGETLTIESVASFVLALLVLAGLASPFFLAKHTLSTDRTGAKKAGPLAVYVLFWALGAAAVAAGFLFSTVAAGKDAIRIPAGTGSESSRYVVPIFFALAACAPVWANKKKWGRPAAAGAVAAYCVLSLVAVARFAQSEPAFMRQSAALRSFLSESNLVLGYAGYWDSHALTLASGLETKVLPVFHCHPSSPDLLCPFVVNVRTVWYRPERDTRTFFIAHPSIPGPVRQPPVSESGPPLSFRRFGDISVYVYRHDIASSFSSGCSRGYFCRAPTGGKGPDRPG